MDNLPELADNGHNWPTYGSWLLNAIADEGLMGLLVGSETRPVHLAQLRGYGETWAPQTNKERDKVAAWRTADESWQRQNATVNLLITYSISDYIFSFILLLKTPLEKFTFLEKRFGQIPRPNSWLGAEEGARQSDSQPEQGVTSETAQSANSHHNEPEIPPSEEEGSLDSPDDCAKTESGYITPETEVLDVQGVEVNLPEVEVEIADAERLDECVHTLEASDKSQHADDEVAGRRNSPEWSSEAPEPADDSTSQTSARSIEFTPKTCLGQDQSLPTSSETILDIPDPPNTRSGHHILGSHVLTRTHGATNTSFFLPALETAPTEPDKGERGNGYSHEISRDSTNLHSVEKVLLIDRGCQHGECKMKWPEDLPVMPALHPASTNYMPKSSKGLQYRARLRSNAENESRQAEWSMAIRNLAIWDNLPRKEDDGRWGHGDATRSGYADSRGVEESPLTDNGGQHSEHGAQRHDSLPASPEPRPNGTMCAPTPYRVPRRCGRIKMRAGSISDAHTRQKAYFTQAAPTRPPLSHFRPMKRLRHPMAGYQTMKKGYNEMRRARKLETRGHMHRTAGILMQLPQLLTDSSKRLRHPTGGLWIQKIGCSEVRHARRVKTRGCTYRTACILMRLLSLLSNTSKWFWNTANTYWQQGVHPRSTRSDAKRPRNCPVAKRLPRSSIRRRGDAHTSIYSLVLPKRPPDGLTHTPRTLRDHHRRGRIKTEAENVSIVRTRPNAYRTPMVAMRPLWLISTPTDPYGIIAGGSPTLGVRYNEASVTRNVQTEGNTHQGDPTAVSAAISPFRQPKKRRKPPWDIADTHQRQGVPPRRTGSDGDPPDSQNGGPTTEQG
ncbi:hypothetical protein EDC04DRAFT_2888950 [Pisolithus marmoratus]|nr:hypothetical protein EDC04DRAFT_2888950 [Pisolithus marmoratus]